MELKKIKQSFVDLLFPGRCVVCRSFDAVWAGAGVCSDCFSDIRIYGKAVCRVCGESNPVGSDYVCGQCLKKPPSWDRALSLTHYNGVVKELLSRLKYSGDTTVIPALKSIVTLTDLSILPEFDFIVPVPLHRRRLTFRGLNQSAVLAYLLFPGSRERISHGLKRIRYTRPQTGLNGRERRNNLKNAFAVDPSELFVGKTVCLVDDVYTTGTTVNSCCEILRKAGAGEIWVISFARVGRKV